MPRHRTIAATPVRSASEAWRVTVQLIADTLERSPDVAEGTVQAELAPLSGLGAALIGGGHLEASPLLLSDVSLDVEIRVVTSDAALTVEENLNPIPGGASATSDWTLYIPAPAHLTEVVRGAVANLQHVSTEPPATTTTAAHAAAKRSDAIDLEAVRKLGSDR